MNHRSKNSFASSPAIELLQSRTCICSLVLLDCYILDSSLKCFGIITIGICMKDQNYYKFPDYYVWDKYVVQLYTKCYLNWSCN